MKKHLLFLFALIFVARFVWAVDPSVNLQTYYSAINGKKTDSNDALRVALHDIIRPHTTISYGSLQNNVFAASSNPSDFYNGSNKTLEDIYSSKAYVSGDSGSGASDCGQGWNKEHTIPQSWFGGSSPMYSDAHHLFPTDIKMNSVRSNYPFGENNADKDCDNYGYGHLGASTFPGYSGQVFDPGDGGSKGSYKGDIARAYFYMVTCYRDEDFTEDSQHYGEVCFTYNNDVAQLTPYMTSLLLKWHREDPVSEKELIRNNAIYAHQDNRNPFVDFPCLAEYIWGEKKGEAVNLNSLISGYAGVGTDCCNNDPTISVSSSEISLATISGGEVTATFTITGSALTGNISISKSGSGFITVSPTSISAANANGTHTITVTYRPTATGTHTTTLTISSNGAASQTVEITGTCAVLYTATWMADGLQFAKTYATSGQSPDVPTNPSDCSLSRVFMGWTAQASVSDSPSDLFTTIAPAIDGDKTFYAVYADVTTGGSKAITYSLANSIAVGDQVVIACNSKSATAGALSSQVLSSVLSSFSSDNSSITSLGEGTLIFTVGGSSGEYTLSTSDGALGATAAKKLAFGSGTTTWDITISGGTATIQNGTSSYGKLQYNSGSPRFTTYTSGQTEIQLYKVSGGTTYSNYSTQCSTEPIVIPEYTVKFYANGSLCATRTGQSGTTIESVPEPNGCGGYSFYGWSSVPPTSETTVEPLMDYASVFFDDTTYHAIYSKTETIGGGGSGTPVVLWSEDFSSYEAGTQPTGSGTISYACDPANTKLYSGDIYAGGEVPELLIAKNDGTFAVEGIPTQNAIEMTLTFRLNKNSLTSIGIDSETSGISMGEATIAANVVTCPISNSGAETFGFVVTNGLSSNCRVDNFQLTTSGGGSSSVTYFTAHLSCTPTGIDELEVREHKARKVLENGQLLIILDDRVYDTTGKRVR